MEILSGKNIVKVSHELNRFRGAYTRLELDFIYAFISCIQDKDDDFCEYSIHLNELEKKLEKRLRLERIKPIFRSLIGKSFEIENAHELVEYTFFTKLKYDKDKDILSMKFNPDLKPHLLKLKPFAMGNLKYILEFTSEYTKRIYMLITQWKTAKEAIFNVSELMEILDVPKSLRVYADFKRKVLQIAQREMFSKSDICFDIQEKKTGKKVTSLLFIITKNEKFYPKGEAKLFEVEVSEFDEFIGKSINTNDGPKEIVVIEKLGGELKVYFEVGSVLIPTIELLKKALKE